MLTEQQKTALSWVLFEAIDLHTDRLGYPVDDMPDENDGLASLIDLLETNGSDVAELRRMILHPDLQVVSLWFRRDAIHPAHLCSITNLMRNFPISGCILFRSATC